MTSPDDPGNVGTIERPANWAELLDYVQSVLDQSPTDSVVAEVRSQLGAVVERYDSAKEGNGSDDSTADVGKLDWITAKQAELLESELAPIYDDWRAWLSEELDARRPQWRGMTAEALTQWLDDLIPILVLPPADLNEFVDSTVLPVLNDPEITAEIDLLDDEEFLRLLEEIFAQLPAAFGVSE